MFYFSISTDSPFSHSIEHDFFVLAWSFNFNSCRNVCSSAGLFISMHDEKAKKTGESIFSVTQNLTWELPQFLHDFGDYACKFKNYNNPSHELYTLCDFLYILPVACEQAHLFG